MRRYCIAPVVSGSPRKGTSATFDVERTDLDITGPGNWVRYGNRPANDVQFADMMPWTFNMQGPGPGTERLGTQYTLTLEHAINQHLVIRNESGVIEVAQNSFEAGGTTVTTSNPAVLPVTPQLRQAAGVLALCRRRWEIVFGKLRTITKVEANAAPDLSPPLDFAAMEPRLVAYLEKNKDARRRNQGGQPAEVTSDYRESRGEPLTAGGSLGASHRPGNSIICGSAGAPVSPLLSCETTRSTACAATRS